MRPILACLIAVLAASPALATEIELTDQRGITWAVTIPPLHWLNLNPEQEINIYRLPEAEVGPICSTAVGKAEPFGCSLIYPLADGACDVYVSSDLPDRSRRIVEAHETAHCNGWPADHPVD